MSKKKNRKSPIPQTPFTLVSEGRVDCIAVLLHFKDAAKGNTEREQQFEQILMLAEEKAVTGADFVKAVKLCQRNPDALETFLEQNDYDISVALDPSIAS